MPNRFVNKTIHMNKKITVLVSTLLAAAAFVPAFADDTTTTETTARTLYWKGSANDSWSDANKWATDSSATAGNATFSDGDSAVINKTSGDIYLSSNVSAGTISVATGTTQTAVFLAVKDADLSLTASKITTDESTMLVFRTDDLKTLTVTGTTPTALSGNFVKSGTGTLDLSNTTFASGSNLTLSAGTTIISGLSGKSPTAFLGNLSIGINATAVVSSWMFMASGCAAQTVLVQGTLDLGTTGIVDFESGESGKLVLEGGTIKGGVTGAYGRTGMSETGIFSAYNTTITVKETTNASEIQSGIKLSNTSILTLDTAENATLVVSGKIENYLTFGIGGLVKTGAGTLVLSGDNSFGGTWKDSTTGEEVSCGLTIQAGTVKVESTTALGGGAVTVMKGATMEIDVAAIKATGGVRFAEGSKLALADTLFSGVTESVDVLLSKSLMFGTTTLTDGDVTATVSSYMTGATSNIKKWTYNASTGALTAVVIPEPSAFGLLAGIGALALAISRRRRKN